MSKKKISESRRPPSIRSDQRDDHEQSRLFIEKAHEIGADEEKSRADELIGELARQPPEPRKTTAQKTKPGQEGRAGRNREENGK